MERRHFTLEEANDLLPWLIDTLAVVMPLREELVGRQEDLLTLMRERRGNGASSKDREVTETQRTVERLTQQLQRQLLQITEQGIIVRDLARWLVDFPSYREGREVYLCWIRDEETIEYWHETNAGFDSRQPI